MDGLKDVLARQRAIGNNLNQLTTLANLGRIRVVNLDGAAFRLAQISDDLRAIAEKGRWSQ